MNGVDGYQCYSSSSDPFELLLEALRTRRDVAKRTVRLLLGTDAVDIPNETRVGLTPKHIGRMVAALRAIGVPSEIFLVENAGVRAGFSNEAYAAVGAQIVAYEDVGLLPEIDVVHALKEPSKYESQVPGQFVRIGALHLPTRPKGVVELLSSRTCSAIFDGSTIGSCSYLVTRGDRTPVVASMSRIAGELAGEWVATHLNQLAGDSHKETAAVVIGAGVAGMEALSQMAEYLTRCVVFETSRSARERASKRLKGNGIANLQILSAFAPKYLDGADGLVFAHRVGSEEAPKICTIEDIQRMRTGAVIVDIAIDQGGSIKTPPQVTGCEEVIAYLKAELGRHGLDYRAEVNMPRHDPERGSTRHGDAILPYILLLLSEAATHESSADFAKVLLKRRVKEYSTSTSLPTNDLIDCYLQDLRNGLTVAVIDQVPHFVRPPHSRSEEDLANWVESL